MTAQITSIKSLPAHQAGSNTFTFHLDSIDDKLCNITIGLNSYTIRTPYDFKIHGVKPGWNIASRVKYGKNLDKERLLFVERF